MTGLRFKKSSYSGAGEDCAEVAQIPATFRKSSHSGQDQDCVEVGPLPCGAAMRESKHPDAGHLPFPTGEWTSFLTTSLG